MFRLVYNWLKLLDDSIIIFGMVIAVLSSYKYYVANYRCSSRLYPISGMAINTRYPDDIKNLIIDPITTFLTLRTPISIPMIRTKLPDPKAETAGPKAEKWNGNQHRNSGGLRYSILTWIRNWSPVLFGFQCPRQQSVRNSCPFLWGSSFPTVETFWNQPLVSMRTPVSKRRAR